VTLTNGGAMPVPRLTWRFVASAVGVWSLALMLAACSDVPTAATEAPVGSSAAKSGNSIPSEWQAHDLGPGNGGRINNRGHILEGRRVWRQGVGWRAIPIDGLDIADKLIVGMDDQGRLVTLASGDRLTILDFAALTTRRPAYSDINAEGVVVGWMEPEPLEFRYHAWLLEPRRDVQLVVHTFHEFETCCINDRGEVLVREWGVGHGAMMILGGFDLLRDISLDLFPVDWNDSHEVVGRRLIRDENDVESWLAFYWSPGAGYIELVDGDVTTFASINNRGIAVGSRDGRAFAWSFAGGFVDLGEGVATDINDRNEIVGARNGRSILWRPSR
jgi:hypothetical protein